MGRMAGDLAPEAVFRENLRRAVPGLSGIVFTDNRRQLASVKKNRDGSLSVRLQHAFRAASGRDLEALARFIKKPDAASRAALAVFVEKHREMFASLSDKPAPRQRTVYCVTRGRNRDLAAILKKVMADYALKVEGLFITFGNDPLGRLEKSGDSPAFKGRTRTRSIRFGSYTAAQNLIRIHPLLDCLDMPQYFVEYIVYHEVLHALCPPINKGGRKSVHTPEFRARERMFVRYSDAVKFEREWAKRCL